MSTPRAGEKARIYLQSLIEQCRLTGTTRLPTVRAMAAKADVSVSIMWRTVAGLRDQGVLSTRQGGWIALAESEPRTSAGTGTVQKWQRTREQIARDVITGKYRPGAILPKPKEMTERYGVSYRTLRKATEALAQSAVLSRYRGGYRVPFAGGGVEHNGSLILIVRGRPDGGPTAVGPNTVQLIRQLESSCAQARLTLELAPFDYVAGRLCSTPLGRALTGGNAERPLGFVVLTTGVQNPDPDYPDNLLGLAPILSQYAAPIVFVSETGERLDAASAHFGPRLTVVSMSNSPTIGARLAQRLLALGHRHMAYISAYHEAVWSKNRCAGLTETVSQAGDGHSVSLYERGDVLDAEHLRPFRDRIEVALKRMVTLCKQGKTHEDRMVGTVLNSESDTTGERIIQEAVKESLQSLFRDALSSEEITAWVCANDTVALAALGFLAANRKKVPEQISVVGFDDSAEAMSRRLTSYNFDCTGTVHAVLHHALGPVTRPRSNTAREEDIEGYLVERGTLGACGRSAAISRR